MSEYLVQFNNISKFFGNLMKVRLFSKIKKLFLTHLEMH